MGRLKDVIIIRGRNHYPQDIEQTVGNCHPALSPNNGAAFTVEIAGEDKLVIVQEVERSQRRQLDRAAVETEIRTAVSEQHELQIHAILLLKPGTVLKTSSGKIQRQACRQAFLDNTFEQIVTPVAISSSASTDKQEEKKKSPQKATAIDHLALKTLVINEVQQQIAITIEHKKHRYI